MRTISILCILLTIGPVALGYAEDQVSEKKRFSNETSISLVNTTGNTDTLSLAGKNEMTYLFSENLSGSWIAGAIYNETNGIKETERYYTDLRADYSINDRLYCYGLGSWFQDKFSGFDHRVGIGPGLGYRLLVGPAHFLSVEGGLNYTYENYTDPEEDDDGFWEGRLFTKYEWAFTEKTKFSQRLEYLQSSEESNTWKINSETALITSLTDILALKISYTVLYNNNPLPSELNNTDTIFTTSMVISF
jgi:putative salt-induced outer membrane protein